MSYRPSGNEQGPLLIAIPGLLGRGEDFRAILADLEKKYFILILDPNQDRKLSELTAAVMHEVSYSSTSSDIKKAMDALGRDKAYVTGLSMGGKIVYDFAMKYPAHFLGGVVTDVGPGSFEGTDLFKFIDKIVTETDMNLPWDEMKLDLKKRIPDRSMRTLIQTQLHYPDQKPPAVWKTAMANFKSMLQRQSIDEQMSGVIAVDAQLAKQKTFIHVFHASYFSGIEHSVYEQMKTLKSMRIIDVPESSHFVHITHKDLIVDCLMNIDVLAEK